MVCDGSYSHGNTDLQNDIVMMLAEENAPLGASFDFASFLGRNFIVKLEVVMSALHLHD